MAVVDNAAEAREKAARVFAMYGMLPNYQRMLTKEGAAGPADVVIVGTEAEVEKQIRDVVVEKLELDEAAMLAGACWRVNKSFFEKKAETILGALGINPEIGASLKSSLAGLRSSALSSATGTG